MDWIPEPDGPVAVLRPVCRVLHQPWSPVRTIRVGKLSIAWEAKSERSGPYRIQVVEDARFEDWTPVQASLPYKRNLASQAMEGAWWSAGMAWPNFRDWIDIARMIGDVLEVCGLASETLTIWGVEEALIQAIKLTATGGRNCWTILDALKAGPYATQWGEPEPEGETNETELE